MGVVVRRYIDILTINVNFFYSTCISSFLAAASLLHCSFFNVFSVLFMSFFTIYKQTLLKEHLRSFKKIGITRI